MTQHADTPDLICPGCGEPVSPQAPAWTLAWGPAPAYSHLDGEPLCPVIGPHGYRPTGPAVHEIDEIAIAGQDADDRELRG